MILEEVTDLFPTKSMQLLMYIMEHTDEHLVFSRTYTQMQKDLNVSRVTIASSFKILQNIGVINYLGNSRWKVNLLGEGSDSADGDEYYVRSLGS